MLGLPALRTTTPIQGSRRLAGQHDVVAEEIPVTRIAHNVVEREYRTRLNSRFSSLLESIPEDVLRSTVNSVRKSDGTQRKVSKSGVMVLARRAIEVLEKKIEVIEHENKTLRGTMDTTNDVRSPIAKAD
jgi:hypothetical protein